MNPFERERLTDTVRDLLDKHKQAAVRYEAARIDACACRTERDWDKFHEAETDLTNVEDAVTQELIELVLKSGK